MYLEGNHITLETPKQAKAYIGKQVQYLRGCDIDKSGRGYFFPKMGEVIEVYDRNINISGSWIAFSQIREIILL